MHTNRCVCFLTCLPLAPPSQQKEKKVNVRSEEGNSIVLKCNPPQSSMEPIIHWMDWSEYITFPSLLPLSPSCLLCHLDNLSVLLLSTFITSQWGSWLFISEIMLFLSYILSCIYLFLNGFFYVFSTFCWQSLFLALFSDISLSSFFFFSHPIVSLRLPLIFHLTSLFSSSSFFHFSAGSICHHFLSWSLSYFLSPSLSTGLHHIQLSERVVVGKDGNLYFAYLKTEDSRDDYTCNVQYLATRTILAKEPITLTVNPCEFRSGSAELNWPEPNWVPEMHLQATTAFYSDFKAIKCHGLTDPTNNGTAISGT